MVLGSRLALHDVDDVERLCRRVIRQSGLELNFHEEEDLLAYLVATTWELSLRFERGVIRKDFGCWATVTLKRRTTDWVRAKRGRTVWKFAGRTHTRERPTIISLDDDPERSGMAEALRARGGDVALDSSPDLERLLALGDRQRARDYAALGLDPPRRAA